MITKIIYFLSNIFSKEQLHKQNIEQNIVTQWPNGITYPISNMYNYYYYIKPSHVEIGKYNNVSSQSFFAEYDNIVIVNSSLSYVYYESKNLSTVNTLKLYFICDDSNFIENDNCIDDSTYELFIHSDIGCFNPRDKYEL
jgi:hypothetical protein